jgi:hypothetical protein
VWRTISFGRGSRVNKARPACQPAPSVRNCVRYSMAWPRSAWLEVGFEAISMAFSTYLGIHKSAEAQWNMESNNMLSRNAPGPPWPSQSWLNTSRGSCSPSFSAQPISHGELAEAVVEKLAILCYRVIGQLCDESVLGGRQSQGAGLRGVSRVVEFCGRAGDRSLDYWRKRSFGCCSLSCVVFGTDC